MSSSLITRVASRAVTQAADEMDGRVLTRPVLAHTDGLGQVAAVDVEIGDASQVLRNVPLARANRALTYADIGSAVRLRRSGAGQWEVIGFSREFPGTYTRTVVNLIDFSSGPAQDLSRSDRALTYIELSIFGTYGVIPYGAVGGFVGGGVGPGAGGGPVPGGGGNAGGGVDPEDPEEPVDPGTGTGGGQNTGGGGTTIPGSGVDIPEVPVDPDIDPPDPVTPAAYLEPLLWDGAQFLGTRSETFVAANGATGSRHRIWTSPDGNVWTRREGAIDFAPTRMLFNGTRYVALGAIYAATSTNLDNAWSARAQAPLDGVKPFPRFPSSNITFGGGVWTGTQFVVVGTQGYCETSPDGLTWTLRGLDSLTSIMGLNSLAHIGGVYVATVGFHAIYRSTDLETWTQIAYTPVSPNPNGYFRVKALAVDGKFYVVGEKYRPAADAISPNTDDPVLMRSDDAGLTWTTVGYSFTGPTASSNLNLVRFNSLFVARGGNFSAAAATIAGWSIDRSIRSGSVLVAGPTVLVGVDRQGLTGPLRLVRTTDGITWTEASDY